MRKLCATYAIMLLAALVGCSQSGQLDRPKAATLLRDSEQVARLQSFLYLAPAASEAGLAHDLWDEAGRLTPRGDSIMTELRPRSATLRTPLGPPEIDVTGISDAPFGEGHKEVQFRWRNSDLAPPLLWIATNGGTGTAVFRLFDDGWRIEEVDVSYSDSSAIRSEEDRARERRDREEVRVRREAAAAERARRLAASRTPSEPPLSLGAPFYLSGGNRNVGLVFWISASSLTDVDVTFTRQLWWTSGWPEDRDAGPLVLWLGDMTTVTTADSEEVMRLRGRDVRCTSCAIIIEVSNPQLQGLAGRGRFILLFPEGGRDVAYQRLRLAWDKWRSTYSDLLPFAN